MYIQPNGTVRLLYNVPLDSDYNDTIYFANRDAQTNYFTSHSGVTLEGQSYTRVDQGIFRCSLPMSQVYNVNYMMFKNTGFEDKWFYAFVNSITYTNNGRCDVHFTIDVIQTWLFNGSMQGALKECYVEREIVADDTTGIHIEPEGLPTGEFVFNGESKNFDIGMENLNFIVMVVDVDGEADGNIYDKVYSGATLYRCNGKNQINTILNDPKYKNKPDSIVGIYALSQRAFPDGIEAGAVIPNYTLGKTYDFEIGSLPAGSSLNGYVPKNNKLYTYPYNFMTVHTGTGQTSVYPYEFFTNGSPKFRMHYNILTPVSVVLEPYGYKDVSSLGTVVDLTNKLTLDGYPMCSWNYDAYAVWQVQQGVVNQTNMISSIGMGGAKIVAGVTGMGLAPMTGGLTGVAGAGAIMSGMSDIFNTFKSNLQDDYLASYASDVSKGVLASGNNTIAQNQMAFYHSRMSITGYRAKQIDDFFSMFGYAVNEVKVPNISSRPHWNYVKCQDVNINASMPNDDKDICKAIFNRGIRFWKNASEIGNYELVNK